MKRSRFLVLLALGAIIGSAIAAPVTAARLAPVSFTILHTNDFHGNLEQYSGGSSSNPGMARVAQVVNDVRSAVGADKVLLVDAGDEMQGSLLSNLQKGEPTIAVFKAMGYDVATFGNHEFDWGQTVLGDRVTQASSEYPYVSANIVVKDGADCASSGWTSPSFVSSPYEIKTIGDEPNQVKIGFIGVTSTETPTITVDWATAGLCFKDPYASIVHYYAELKAATDVIVVLSHLGYADGGYGYGLPVYGDQTLAKMLIAAGKPVPLIIGGHSHTDVATPVTPIEGKTTVVQARYNGRQVGRADLTVAPDGTVSVAWSKLAVPPAGTADPTVDALIQTYASDPAYQELINTEIGWTNVPIARNYDGDSLMGTFVNDSIYGSLNGDATPANDVDIVFNNSGGLRADIACAAYPCKLTYGMMFSVLPFGNQTVVGSMTGARILEVLNQGASLTRGPIQVAGIRYQFYNYKGGTPTRSYAWGAFDPCVIDADDGSCDPLDLNRTYRVATNEFLAPAGQDNFYGFKYTTDVTYWGDMLNTVNDWVSETYTAAHPFNGALDGRITRDGTDAGGTIVPVTVLHHNDSHGNLAKGSYVGYTQLATLIKQERAYNPDRTILVSSGDNIQGDAMMYYFKTAAQGEAADGTPLDPTLQMNPLIKAFNAMGYDAMTLGNHEFNFGSQVFTTTLGQANFPILQANLSDTGDYGIDEVPVEPYVVKTVGPEGIEIAILGIGNHRVPNYELASNIPGLTFTNPLTTAQALSDELRSGNDIVLALTHIGFTENPGSVEVDDNIDTVMAAQVSGLDAIVGGHSHTNPATGFGDYKYLPTIIGGPSNTPVVVTQAYRYNNTLGELFIGLRPIGQGAIADVNGFFASGEIDNAGIRDSLLAKLANAQAKLASGQTKAATNVLKAFINEVKAQAGKYVTTEAAAALIAAAEGLIARPDGYEVVSRAGQYLAVPMSTVEDPAIKAIVNPYVALLAAYNNTEIGSTTAPIDALTAYTEETTGANLQADASVYELVRNGIDVDFHLSGAMSNRKVADAATPGSPVTLKVSDMFTLMPYENSLVVMEMNGPQLKAVLERAYRNYYYYKYVPGYGGYSYYTTCMLDTNAGNNITYDDTSPVLPSGDNVVSLTIGGVPVDFTDAGTYYKVSTVNYLAAGSCNFNDGGVSLWPLSQISDDTQLYVRDAAINYITHEITVSPAIEGRLTFN
jgi:2',3'-cyclic-nucleotide 2'-phosphodiesterase (5'-nucleotidase family)